LSSEIPPFPHPPITCPQLSLPTTTTIQAMIFLEQVPEGNPRRTPVEFLALTDWLYNLPARGQPHFL